MNTTKPCPRCKSEIHPVRELARNCPRCMDRFHARCARDGDACTTCERVFKPLQLDARIEDGPRPFWPRHGNWRRGVWIPLF